MSRFFRELNSKWTYLSSEKEQEIRWLLLHKAWNRKVSRRSRAMTAKHMTCRVFVFLLTTFFFPPCCLQRRRFLSSLFVSYTGLHDQGVESEFEWSDGSAVQYTYWKDWNPDNWANSEDCVNVRSDNDGRWNDENCRTNRPYICKKSKGYQTNGRNTYFNFYSNGAPPRPKVRLSNDVFEE